LNLSFFYLLLKNRRFAQFSKNFLSLFSKAPILYQIIRLKSISFFDFFWFLYRLFFFKSTFNTLSNFWLKVNRFFDFFKLFLLEFFCFFQVHTQYTKSKLWCQRFFE